MTFARAATRAIALATTFSMAGSVGCRSGFSGKSQPDGSPSIDASSTDSPQATCGPKPITAIDETGVLFGSTEDENNDRFGSCSGARGPEAVASIDLDSAVQDLSLSLSAADFGPALYVRTDCEASPAEEVTCSILPTAVARDVGGERLLVFIDSSDGRSGTFLLTATMHDRVSSPCEPEATTRQCTVELECEDNTCQPTTCGKAVAQTDSFITSGTTSGATSLHAGSCDGGGFLAPEAVFAITLTNPVTDLIANTNLPGTEYDSLLYLRDGCDGTEIACNDDSEDSNRSSLNSGPLAAGTYFLFVDGFDTRSGAFDLSVTLVP